MSAVILCGSREWSDVDAIREAVRAHLMKIDASGDDHPTFVTGGAPGADELGAIVARTFGAGYEVRVHPADWEKHGRAAGPIRNQMMLDVEAPDHVLAFVRTDLPCKGTWDMIHRALKAGVPVTIIPGRK